MVYALIGRKSDNLDSKDWEKDEYLTFVTFLNHK